MPLRVSAESLERHGVEIDFKSDHVPTSLSPDVSLCLFRVLQEALQNTAKHSGVGRFVVQLGTASGHIQFVVSDLGEGFEIDAVMKGGGLGLMSMRERLRIVKGALTIESWPKRGTTIYARVPLVSEEDSARAG